MACLYKRRNGFWISYRLDGRLVQKSLRTDDERLARDKVKQIESELVLGMHTRSSKLELPAILEAFCSYLRSSRTHKSYKNDFSRLRIFFGPICESLKPGKAPGSKRPASDRYASKHVRAKLLEDVTPQMINRFLAARIEQGDWSSAKTANLTRQLLHELFAYATKHHGFIGPDRRYPNPVSGVDHRPEAASQIRFLTLEQVHKQLEVLRNHSTIHAMVSTYIYAGLRREAATWLTREDVDLDKRLIRVKAKTVGGKYWQPKTRKNRVVPISKALFAILSAYEPPPDCIWFFPSPTRRHWDPENFSRDLRRINKAHDLDWTCLDYRHTFGSHLAMKGESLYKISALMGNSPDICRRHYAALIPEEMVDVVEFGKPSDTFPAPPDDNVAQATLELVLKKLDGLQTAKSESPRLRLLRPIDRPAS